MTDQEAWIALNRAELPPKTALQLLELFGSPQAILQASSGELVQAAQLSSSQLERLKEAVSADLAGDLRLIRDLKVSLVTIKDLSYPAHLLNIYDPPPLLFVRGELRKSDQKSVAIVGARRASPYGKLAAESLARDLAQNGITVVSGVAVGADTAAHRGALAGGGRTIGVLACGLEVDYPAANRELKEQMVENGALITESPFSTPAQKERFPARNRIISGMSLGTVVVEAAERSGALITAHHALEQGREVFAVPGSVNSVQSRGTHRLIKEGAKLVESVEDILEELDLPLQQVEAPDQEEEKAQLSDDEQKLLGVLSLQQKYMDEIIEESSLSSAEVNSLLMMLELKGLVRRLPGNLFLRVR